MHFALVEHWWGLPCAVHRDRTPGSTASWERVSPEEWADLLAEGFRVCLSWTGPAS